MAELTITEAIKLSPIGRTRFYSHYIKEGLITVGVNSKGDKFIDSTELFRVFGDVKDDDSESSEHEQGTTKLNAPAQETNAVVQLLREQLKKSEEREEHYRKHIDSLTLRLEAPAQPEPVVSFAPIKRQSRLSVWWYGLDSDTRTDGKS